MVVRAKNEPRQLDLPLIHQFDSSKWTGLSSDPVAAMRKLLKGTTPATKAKRAVKWFQQKIKDTSRGERRYENLPRSEADLLKQKDRYLSQAFIGRMMFFRYDPKWKDVLPYYDEFPLIFPIEIYNDGFLGLNFHYLPIRDRLVLLQALSSALNNKKYDHTTRLKLSWGVVKKASQLAPFCVKRYLSSHVRSRFIGVEPYEWEVALWLPVEQFQKAPTSRVWRDARKHKAKYKV